MINFSKLAAVAKIATKAQSKAASVSPNKEQEMLSRRAALRRIGMTGGMTVLGLLTIDELARVSAQKLEQNELTRGIAKDFRSAGVAFADPGPVGDYQDCELDGFGNIVWLGPGVCMKKPPKPKIPVPDSCKPGYEGEITCEQCMEDITQNCGGLNPLKLRACQHQATLCFGLFCGKFGDSQKVIDAFVDCMQKTNSK